MYLSIAFFPILANECAAAESGMTYFVRTDGGSADQCDGRRDSAYSGSGRDQSCAWRHPFEALPPGGPSRIAGGDTLVIASGSYMMGMGAPGSEALEKCRTDWPWDCHAAAVPSGPSADRPTRIRGAGFDRGCANAPELWGTQRASTVIDLAGSSNVELACLEITDHSSCVEFHHRADPVQRCERDAQPYGAWASIGISASDSSNVRLSTIDIHGLAHDGIRAGRLHDWTLQNVKINANGWSGWNGDIGDHPGSSNSGHLIFRDVEIAWNGCAEKFPGRQHFGCWGEENGGYGDGLGTGETGGIWLFERVNVHHNTQDGIDLLHAKPGATIAFDAVRAEANAGNQLKATGSVNIRNSVVIGSCSALGGDSGLDPSDLCRAAGDSISLRVSTHAQDEIVDSTVEGQGNCLISLTCAGEGCLTGSAAVSGDHLSGTASETSDHGRLPCTVWVEPELRGARLQFSNNDVHSVRSTACPAGIGACSDNHDH